MFKTDNANINFEGQSLPQLEPEIYKEGTIVKFAKGTKSARVDGEDVMTDTIDIHLANATGAKHVAQEKEPTDPEKYGSFFEKMLHILSSFMSKEDLQKAAKAKIEDFAGLQDFMTKAHEDYYKAGHKVDFKLEGNAYNGNAFVRLPNFNAKYGVPFIKASANKEISLKFSNSELKNLAAYKKIVSGEASQSPDLGGAPSSVTGEDDPGF